MVPGTLRRVVPTLILAALAACHISSRDRAPDPGQDEDSDSATLRAEAMSEWYTESTSPPHRDGGIWSHAYRAYLLDVAREERQRWTDTFPGVHEPHVINGSVWTSLGPDSSHSGPNGDGGTPVTDSGRITAIIPDGTRLFVATAGGGVWRRDAGAWKPLSETIGTLSTGALAMDPANHQRLYLGLGDSFDGTGIGMLISNDGGDTWSNPIYLGNSTVIPAILVDPASSQIVLVATDKGLYRSTDGGTSFAAVSIPTGLTADTKIWSVAWTGGHGFVLSLGTLQTDSPVTENGQVWTSSNDGATWTRATGITASGGLGRITVASAPSNRQIVYAEASVPNTSTTNDLADLFRSTDGGATWTALDATQKQYTNTSDSVGGLLNAQGWYNQLVLVDPNNANTAYFGGALLLAETTDGGTTFTAVTDWLGSGLPYVHADFHAGAIDATGLYVGTDGGIYQSTDGGSSFSNSLNVGLVTHLVYTVASSPAAPSEVLGGMQDNGTRLRDGTSSAFDEVLGGDGFGAAISRTNGQLMLGSIYFDQIEKSSDGGASWNDSTLGITEAGDQNNAPFITQIVPWEGPTSTGNEVYTFSNSKVYRSTNFGSSWAALPATVTTTAVIRNIGVAASNANIVGVVGSGGNVWLSQDSGTTWSLVATGKGADPMALPNSDRSLSWIHFDVSDPHTVYVASVAPEASVNHLWKSTDFGAHWTSIDGNGLPVGVPINVIKSDPVPGSMPGKILYAGTHLGVYRSVDGGATWARFGAGMPLVSVMDLYVSPDDSIVRAATFGRGFWELKPPTQDFSISANPTSVAVGPGGSGTTAISTAVTVGAAQAVTLSVSGLPTGATGMFSATHITSGGGATLTLTAGATTPGGTYPVMVTATGPQASHTATVSFTVGAADDFALTADPASVIVAPGGTGATTVSTSLTNGVAQNVAFSVDGLPAGITAAFAPPSANVGTSTTLTFTAGTAAAPGTYSVTVTGTGPSAMHTATVSVMVVPAGDFSIAVAPTKVTVAPGATGTATVTTTVTAGTGQMINLSASGLPDGTTATFEPATITAGQTATLTITTSADTPAGSQPITIAGVSDAATHTATLTLDVGGSGNGETGDKHGGCCDAGGAGGAGDLLIALAVFAFGLAPRRRRERGASSAS